MSLCDWSYWLSVVALGALACLALGTILLVGWAAFRAVVAFLGVQGRRSADASHLRIAPSPQVEPTVAALTALGFRRLGETQTSLPFSASPAVSWILVDPEATTQAQVVALGDRALLVLLTMCRDGAAAETGYPYGEQIETAGFRSHTVPTSIEDAYRRHLRQSREFAAGHGGPRPVLGLADALEADAIYRLRHAQRKMLRPVLYNVAHVALAAAALATLAAALLWPLAGPPTVQLRARLMGLCAVLLPAETLTLVLARLNERGSRINTAKRAPWSMSGQAGAGLPAGGQGISGPTAGGEHGAS